MRELRVAAAAPDIRVGDLEGNLARCRDALVRARAEGAALTVLPELATSGYVFEGRGEAGRLALSATDPRWTALVEVLGPDDVAVIGFCEREGDRLFNSAAVIGGRGPLGLYRKAHLWGAETQVFTPGDAAGAVVATPCGRLGVAICYDNEFPEVPRRLALAGAELLALPVCWPRVPRPAGEHAPETIQAMAAARSSRLATVVADRAGLERGVEWTGGTAVISDEGWIRALPDGSGLAVATLVLRGGDKALPPYNDLFADRRPALY